MVHLGDDVFVHSGDDVYKCLLLCRRLHCLKAGCQAVTGRADEDAAALLMMEMIYVLMRVRLALKPRFLSKGLASQSV